MIADEIKLANWDINRTVNEQQRQKVIKFWLKRLEHKDKRIKVTNLGVIYLEKDLEKLRSENEVKN